VPAKRTTVVRAGEPDAQHAASRTMPRGTHRADDLDAGACQWFVSLSLALRQVCRILYFFAINGTFLPVTSAARALRPRSRSSNLVSQLSRCAKRAWTKDKRCVVG